MAVINNFLTDEGGLELSEYAIAAALITLALIAALTNLGRAITCTIKELKAVMMP